MYSLGLKCLLYISGLKMTSKYIETKTFPTNCNLIFSTLYASTTFTATLLCLMNIITFHQYLFVVPISISYCIFDIYYLFKNNFKMKYQLLFHHLIIVFMNLLVYMYYYYTQPYYINYFLYNYLSEVTNIFLNLSMYLHSAKLTQIYPKLYNCSNIALLTTYFIFRILNFLYLTIGFYYINYTYFTIQASIMILNFIWFYKLIKINSKINNIKTE